jgi:hypothetical protein
MLLAVHRQEPARQPPLRRLFRPSHREEPRMVPLRVREHFLIEFRTEQKYDPLTAVLDHRDGPVPLVQPADPVEQVSREFAEINPRNRRIVSTARGESMRLLRILFESDGH